MASVRRPILLATIALVVALTAIGTVLWIVRTMRPAPVVPPAPIVAERVERDVLTVAVRPSRRDPIDQLGATVRALGLAIASGRAPSTERFAAIAVEAAAPRLRLVFDRGVLAAGAASGQTGDHLLGLAGAGSRWPDRAATDAYCGRLENSRGDFCAAARGAGRR